MSTAKYRVEWALAARGDLQRIFDYLAASSPEAARRTLDRLERKAAALAEHPRRGRLVPELGRLHVRQYLELVIPPYRLLYRIDARRVLVMGVFDGRRNLEDIFLERLLSE